MATLKTNLIEPEGATTTLIVGEAGGDLVIGADSLKVNLVKAKETITAFTSTGAQTWTCPTGVTSVEVLTVAGGGGAGGQHYSGGGGGGGVVHDTAYTVVPAVVYDLTVGAGGSGGGNGIPGTVGDDSTWNDNAEGSGVKHTAKGGGGGSGGDAGDAATAGGSGGGRNWAYSGSSGPTSPDDGGASNQQSSGTATGGTVISYGFAGGGDGVSFEHSGSGGGGAGAAGGPDQGSSPNPAGFGGAGQVFSSFTTYGVSGYFAGGGGGGAGGYSTGGVGGIGGGGSGGAYNQGATILRGVAGIDGTGGGGGGIYSLSGHDGGDGIILLKYAQPTGGNILFQSDGSGTVSNVNSGWGGVQVLLSSQTASDSTSISFTSGIDSTYEEYIFEFININPATMSTELRLNASTNGGSSYGITKTTTFFRAYQQEDDGGSGLGYDTGSDLAQSTDPQILVTNISNLADATACGELHLFSPSSTTYGKNFYSEISNKIHWPGNDHVFVAGYLNTTSAIDAVKFDVDSGTFDGTIKMYGIK